MASNEQENLIGIEQSFKDATKAIEDAEEVMSRTKASVEKAKASKDGRNKVVSKASEIVNALLQPASQVANLLNNLGGLFPPCGVAGSVLQGIIDLESGRRENDARIGLVFVDMSTTLVALGTLKPGFEKTPALAGPLASLVNHICDTMKSFGQFSEAFYDAKTLKSMLKHFIHAKSNKEKLAEFHDQFVAYKQDLRVLLSQQTVLISSSNSVSLARIEVKIDKFYGFFASLMDEKEYQSVEFIERCGGEERVQNDDGLLDKLASMLGETLTPSIRRAVKESAEEIFKQSSASFNLKFQFAIEQRIDLSTETILKELRSGPYEIINDPDMKEIWKATAAKESSVKRRQLIDAMAYYFNRQWKKYKVERKADREDFWTRSIISKVHYHPAIGDAVDDDASGYISVEELNDFLRQKPSAWTVPQWVAYWAYGWDADNIFYQEKIDKSYKQLESLRDKPGLNSEHIKHYLQETQKPMQTISRSVYTMNDLDASSETKMNKLRLEWRTQLENTIKNRLKGVNYRIEYSSMSAICGSERIEATFLPLVSLILARHVHLLSQTSISDEDVEEAIYTIETLIDVIRERIGELRVIWRRQRTDVDVQIRYYSNGLFEDFYKENRKDFDTDVADEDVSSWGSEDEWGSEDDAEEHPPTGVDPGVPEIPSAPSSSTQTRQVAPNADKNFGYSARNVSQDADDQSGRYRMETQHRNKPSLSVQSDDGGPRDFYNPSTGRQTDSDSEPDPMVQSSLAPPDSDGGSEGGCGDSQNEASDDGEEQNSGDEANEGDVNEGDDQANSDYE